MSPREQELETLVLDVSKLVVATFNEGWKTYPRSAPPEQKALALDQLSARFAGIAAALQIAAERCSDLAASLLDSTEN